ncbi:urea ABC transporter ATP-binding protein UrtD [Aeribacillus sp. FSL K6-8394]|uniref:urea ABC transporter ATP-binding protein UrtD n=1 Tax=Aeribacillus sp. FSL K6-8394 TaxID=2954570 RepID=UPI0030FB4739
MNPILSCHDIIVDFDGFKALQGVNLDVHHGEIRFLIGPNGAGKTTLLDVICGKTKAADGKVMFQGVDLTKRREHEIVRHGIARKFQNPSVFTELTVFENMELSIKQNRNLVSVMKAKLTAEEKDEITAMLERTDLLDRAYDPAGLLSHGQKQWLEIGMQLLQKPAVLLLDEPIAGMTGAEREKTGLFIQEIAEKCAVLIVEHDMDFVRNFAEQVTVMHEGKILCEGSMEEVQQNELVAEVYLGREAKVC